MPNLTTFAALSLSDSDGRSLLPAGKPLALVAYLALAPRRTATRGQLTSLLWADVEQDRARATLRQTLSSIRAALGASAIATEADAVTLSGEVACDVDAFTAAVNAGDAEGAMHLYAGEFIPDFAFPGGASFEHWRDIEAHRLRGLFIRMAEVRAQQLLHDGEFDAALAIVTRAIEADPDNESLARFRIEVLATAGRTEEARAESLRLVELLACDDRLPEPATQALLKRMQRASGEIVAASDRAQTLQPALVGREVAFARLLRAWQRARGGHAVLVAVEAPSGHGKTRLLDEAAARLRVIGARVVRVTSRRADRDVAGILAGDLITRLASLVGGAGVTPESAAALANIAPNVATKLRAGTDNSPDDDKPRRRAFALADLLAAVAGEGAIAILADDWQWSDDASQKMIETALGRIPRVPVLVVTATRAAAPATSHEQIALPPLPLEQTRALLHSLGDVYGDGALTSLVVDLHRASGGIPLRILQFVYAARERGWLKLEGDAWRVADATALASSLRNTSWVTLRLRDMQPVSRMCLELLACTDGEVGMQTFKTATGNDPASLAVILDQLEDRGLAERTEGGWQIAHDEIATSVAGLLTEQEIAARRIAVSGPPKSASNESVGTRPRGIWWATAAASIALLVFASYWALAPATLRLVKRPVARQGDALFEVAPEVEVLSRAGIAARWWPVNVGVRVVESSVRLAGPSSLRTTNGRVLFDSLRVSGEWGGPYQMEFFAPGLAPLVYEMNRDDSYLELVDGELNGVRIVPGATSIALQPAERIRGWARFKYRTTMNGASVLMAGFATWEPRESDTLHVISLITPAETAYTNVQIDRPMFNGIATQSLVWAFAPEGHAANVGSGTNWKCAAPRWNDGNDVVDIARDTTARRLANGGSVARPWDYCDAQPKQSYRSPRRIGVVVLDVRVGAR